MELPRHSTEIHAVGRRKMHSKAGLMAPVAAKLDGLFKLDVGDLSALGEILTAYTAHEAPGLLVPEGAVAPAFCMFISAGFAIRHKVASDGKRQILSFHMPGDFLDAQHMSLGVTDHSIEAITEVEVICFPRQEFREMLLKRPNVAHAMWIETQIEAAITREWLVNAGARGGPASVSHLLCEIAWRLEKGKLGDGTTVTIPFTQEQIGEAVGLTPVHVNRVLKGLTAKGLLSRKGQQLSFPDWHAFAKAGEFNPLYLAPP
ncbi:Crp/Fnr family transcriptional regulator [Xanthobacteraceae bacterium A53D]